MSLVRLHHNLTVSVRSVRLHSLCVVSREASRISPLIFLHKLDTCLARRSRDYLNVHLSHTSSFTRAPPPLPASPFALLALALFLPFALAPPAGAPLAAPLADAAALGGVLPQCTDGQLLGALERNGGDENATVTWVLMNDGSDELAALRGDGEGTAPAEAGCRGRSHGCGPLLLER